MSYATDLASFARTSLHRMLARLLESPVDLARVARRSYAHDNGFTKLVLVSHREAETALRLHVWPGRTDAAGNIHNHCWDFKSIVLAGALAFQEFTTDSDGLIRAVRHGYVPVGAFRYELRPLGPARLRPTVAGRRRAGEIYDLSAATLHQTWGAAAGQTITLLAQGPRLRERADVYVTRPGGVRRTALNPPLDPNETQALLEDVLRVVPAPS